MTQSQAGKISVGLLVFFICCLHFSGQTRPTTCGEIKNGTFHIYPKNTADHYVDSREGEFVRETNTRSGDSSLYRIKWLNDCTYSLQYISGSEKLSEDMMKILKKHKLVYEVLLVTDDYYVYKGYLDKTSNIPITTDTAWYAEKTAVVNNTVYQQITLREAKIRDTSQYALLYVYRPGKITNSMGNYLVYFDDNAMCVARNKTGYIFRVFKEGRFRLTSRLFKDKSSVVVDVKFGKTYYIKSMIHWGISSRLYNFKLEMAAVMPETGRAEIGEVRIQ